ncbi:MarR family winged helix-turn-helix transcriptional regulator [Rhodanobacter sp. 115]|uniref:MarR family winged helix-turn-helix transcriptional regulator n=1 Tax=Rhodanobacter sp. FW021-MT20 TaxID=1162282 RepID=UPI0034E4F989
MRPSPITNADFEVAEKILHLTARASVAIWHLITQHTRAVADITGMQASVLMTLIAGRCTTSTELARQYALNPSVITGHVDGLEQHGFVKRVPSEFDRRVHLIVPTDEGRGLFGKISPVFSRVLGEVFDGLESEEIEAFQNSLQRMVLKAGMADVGAESKLFRLGVA